MVLGPQPLEEATRVSSGPSHKILVVVLDNLGDAILGSALLPVIKSFHPNSQLGFWTKHYAAGVFRDHPLIDHLHAADPFWDTAPGRKKGPLGPFLSVLSDIRKIKYDTALLLNCEWRRALSCAVAGIPRRVGFQKRKSHFFLTDSFRPMSPDQHVVDDHRSLVEFWLKTSVSPALCHPSVSVSPELFRWGQQWRNDVGLVGKPLVFIHPFSGDEKKNWPIPLYLDALENLRTQNPQLGFVMSAAGNDEKELRAIVARRPHLKISLAIDLPLDQYKGVMSQSRLYIGGDTGPSHLAAALGIPALCLFGPSDPMRYRPRGTSLIRILQVNPLSDLRPSDVVHAATELLEKKT